LKTALITGVAGQDGSYLAEMLLMSGYRVHGVVREATLLPDYFLQIAASGKLQVHTLDLCDAKNVAKLIENTQPDEIYALGTWSSVAKSFQFPTKSRASIVGSIKNIIDAVEAHCDQASVFHASSSEIFGNTSGRANESHATNPLSPYATHKLEAHQMIVQAREVRGLHTVNGILFNHESPRRNSGFFSRKIVQGAVNISNGLQQTLEIGHLDGVRDWGWAPEYVRAIHKMLVTEIGLDMVIASGKGASLRYFVESVFECLSLDYSNYIVESANLIRPSDIKFSVGDSTLAQHQLGWQSTWTFQRIIEELVKSETERRRG
jgi:GDPmannose 4,6-dehydratase